MPLRTVEKFLRFFLLSFSSTWEYCDIQVFSSKGMSNNFDHLLYSMSLVSYLTSTNHVYVFVE